MKASGPRLLFVTVLLSIFYYLFLSGVPDQKLHMRKPHPDVPSRNLTILLWHWPFGRSYSLDGDKCRDLYNIRHCFLSDNPALLSMADVVVFHHHELKTGRSSLPLGLPRPAHQHWVWLSMEPPINNGNLTPFNDLFNWTMSYRRDADIHIPYGKTTPGRSKTTRMGSQKHSCIASWVVSRYKSNQARAGVYQSLKKYLHIEMYGHWVRRPLPDKGLLPAIRRCYFYLAFENSEATDYISEKFWRNGLQAGVVPVVLGPSKATYEALAPPGSFIHVKDFPTAEELATYLKSLAADRKGYEAYFSWYQTHSIRTYTDWRERLCQICSNYSRLPVNKVYHDLDTWASR